MHSYATDGNQFPQRRRRWQAPPALLPGEADLRKLLQLPEQFLTPDIREAIYTQVTRQELERHVSQDSIFIGVRKRQRSIGMAWGAITTIEGQPIIIGNKFQDEVVAARAHDMAALLLSPTRSTKRLNFAAWTYATELMKYKFESQATIIADLRLLQTTCFQYTTIECRGEGEPWRNTLHRDSSLRYSHRNTGTSSYDSGDPYMPQPSWYQTKQWLAAGTEDAQSLSMLESFRMKQDALDSLKPPPSAFGNAADSEATEVQAILRRDSSQSGHTTMSAAHFGRQSHISERSIPRGRQTASVDDRAANHVHRVHEFSARAGRAPRRAMVHDAADKGRPERGRWGIFRLAGGTAQA